MDETPNLHLPYLIAAQAQKHVTHNEALRALDTLVQLSVLDRDLAAPPAAPLDGDRYIVATSASGAWAGKAGEIAAFQDNAWMFHAPAEGWLAWVADEDRLCVFDGSDWTATGGEAVNPAPLIGVNTTADAANKLAVKSDAVLFSHDDVTPGSGDTRHKLNKAAAGNTASVVFQTDWSGRAEFGLAGDDDWHVKVSPDGTNWFEALVADGATGRISFPHTPMRETLTASRTYYVRKDGSDGNDGLSNTSGGAFLTIGRAVDAAYSIDSGIYNVTIQIGDGTYGEYIRLVKGIAGGGSLSIVGNTATPSSVVVGSGSFGLYAENGASASISGIRFTNASYGIFAKTGAVIAFANVEFGTCSVDQIYATAGAYVAASGNYAIAGGAARHMRAQNALVQIQSRTVTITGTPAYTSSFATAELSGALMVNGNTYSGAATGKRYDANLNGVVQTAGGGASYFPGSVAGTVTTGGQYA